MLNKSVFFLCILIIALLSCKTKTKPIPLNNSIKRLVDSTFNNNQDAFGLLIHVESFNKNISYTANAGFIDKTKKESLSKKNPVLIASNTKTYVAAAIMKLIEQNLLNLNQSIDSLITNESKNLLTGRGYKLDSISVRNLLSHTSGIKDYVDSSYFAFLIQNPKYSWTRNEQIKLTAKKGKPSAKPGIEFSYGDINYLLLTEIIEKLTGKPFYQSIRELLTYDSLGLNSTWFAQLETPNSKVMQLAHQYWDKRKMDSYDYNPSWDLYGGGGIASTMEDMAKFYQNLFEGKIIKDSLTLSKMYQFVLPKEKSNYCLGLRKIDFHGYIGYYHGGFWGTDVMYLPELKITIAATTNNKDKRDLNADLSYEIIKLMKK